MKIKYLALVLLIGFASVEATAQSAPPRKDIPAIAKAANGAIVTIITATNDKPIAQGTGFLVSPDGVIVTNYHVIETGNVAIVKFPDDTAFPVDGVLATDKVRDLAIIKIHGKTFRTLALGDSDDIQVGEEVVAIGNPLLLESTVSNGIISGVRSSKEQGGKFLQTTAPISPGSSGGPLFNMRSEVVGINTLYLEGGENLNFAIPVNDAKLLLSHQSAKLQNLPNEDKSAPADVPLPTEASPPTPDEGPSVQPKQTKENYYIRARRNETYTIEYRGHQLTAHCREALAWHDGKDNLGTPMTENECEYLWGKVGKYISEDLMVRQDNELRYRPLAGDPDSLQVADILDITDDVLLAAPKHPHPAPKTSPEIQKTLHWIQNTLDDGEGKTLYAGKDEETDTSRNNRMPELNGCQVTFVYETRQETREGSKATFVYRNQVNLGDLDPTSLTSDVISHDVLGDPVSMVRVHTTDKVPSVSLAASYRGWVPAHVIPTTDLVWELPSPYAERFVKALHHAITLCGGKASTF
ncbi:MAG TPA: trypsin-like peptidase domain-containing protein [Candidatus Acidoferrum sp.]|nr:trypsin-like peptidase domain-containing protein [Candidatus Acidoferrum sp.]